MWESDKPCSSANVLSYLIELFRIELQLVLGVGVAAKRIVETRLNPLISA
jgi:hypothetical protein